MKGMKYILSFTFVACSLSVAAQDLVQYVDTRVGTSASTTQTAGMFGKKTEEYGQTLPAVLEPNGMNFWTPQTTDTELKCKAPYYYKDDLLQGFRNSHWIVGGCTQDYGSMTLMPVSGKLKCMPEERASHFSHAMEVATPAYYNVYLDDYQINAEMTGRSRSAIFRFDYQSSDHAFLVINPNSDEGLGYIEVLPEKKQIRGYNPVHRIYQGKGETAGFSGYFILEYQDEIETWGTYHLDSIFEHKPQQKNHVIIGAYIKFKSSGKKVVRVASSFTGWEGCEKNLQEEIPHWDFDKTRKELTDIWNQRLGQITLGNASNTQKSMFYGAFYRASFLPREFNDVDGKYPSFAGGRQIMQMADGHNYYEDFSMWDTYRALHPLINILSPSKASDMMQSLVLKYEQGGWLPIFPCWNSYTAAMIGDHAIAAIGDAYVKGIRDFDIQKAYEGMRKNAFESPSTFEEYSNGMGRRALKSYLEYGYIPLQDSVKEAYHKNEQTSRTLEYAYDDFVLSQVAKLLGKKTDYELLAHRSMNYKNVIDPKTGYAQGRNADGTFLDENNAFSFSKFITEGAPCHYTWYVPHDVEGLMACQGGKSQFIAKLDSMFSEQRYWHGNEPCHQVAYLFNYGGEPWKSQRAVRHILETEYSNTPGGLAGNDDAGQMSAWYLFSSIGFYPVCPGTPFYVLGSPTFRNLTIKLENGKTFRILAPRASEKNIYVQQVKLNGKKYTKNYISHEDIVNGAVLEFEMGPEPNKKWGSSPKDCPPSYSIKTN